MRARALTLAVGITAAAVVNMPGLSGVDIVKDVQERSPDTAIIVVSAYDVDHLDELVSRVAAVLPKTDLVRFDEVLKSVMAERDTTSAS